MRNLILTVIIGFCAGCVDILPMFKQKQDKNSIASAFILYFISPFIIYNTDLFGMVWWLKGAVITLLLALPNLFLIVKAERKALPIIIASASILGTIVGILGHLLNIYS